MLAFARLLDRLPTTPQRSVKLRLVEGYLRSAPDPDRGWALAALTGGLDVGSAKPALVRGLAESRVDPVLFAYSHDFVGDLAETVALIWPAKPPGKADGAEPEAGVSPAAGVERPAAQLRGQGDGTKTPGKSTDDQEQAPSLSRIVDALRTTPKTKLPQLLEEYLDRLDADGRWALLKLITGSLRVGVSARLAKTALANLGPVPVEEVEEAWHGLKPPYLELFAWLEGRGPRPDPGDKPVFRPLMLATPLEDEDRAKIDLGAYAAEWKWDGIRVQLARRGGEVRLYSRTGDEVTGAFPEIAQAMTFDAVLDGELLVRHVEPGTGEARLGGFNDLQQRLGRKNPGPKTLERFPAFVHLYDVLFEGAEDLRPLPWAGRRARLEALFEREKPERMDLPAPVPFLDLEQLDQLRRSCDGTEREGLMLKRRDSAYSAGRPKGPWFKWKRDALLLDCVVMYAQRGHGKRSSFYSDYTFGLWRAGPNGQDELVPVGKVYSGFTDEELTQLDRWIRNHTTRRYGPVREVERGLVLEVAFDSAQRSTRHKSGLAMRFPRVHRVRWDKPPEEADRVEALEKMVV